MVRIYNPVDSDRIRSIATNAANPFVDPGPHLVASGRLEHAKGFDLLIDAMLEVRKHIPQAKLTILGSGTLEKELRDQCAALGLTATVKFAGFHSNPYPYYLNADLFVLSSRYEGLPNVILEAMALNTQLVATDCPGGVREVVKGWPNCRLARAGDSASLADAIVASLRDGRQPAEAAPDSSYSQTALPFALRAYEGLLLG
jgi:glycosyltransferase involved in cell wall biosynthesis